MELEPPVCTATQPATNWDSERFDAVTADFMQTVCGPQAALGKCEHSVAIQVATSPSWVWEQRDRSQDAAGEPVGVRIGQYGGV